MCILSLNISTFFFPSSTFFFCLEGEIRAEFTPFFLAGSISRDLHDNFYLQSQMHILRRRLLRFVQIIKAISVLSCESATAPRSQKNPDHLFREMTLIHLNPTEERIPYFKPCNWCIQILNDSFLYGFCPHVECSQTVKVFHSTVAQTHGQYCPFLALRDGNELQPSQHSSEAAAPLLMLLVGHWGTESKAACPEPHTQITLLEHKEKCISILAVNKPHHANTWLLLPSPRSGTSALVQWHRRGKEFFLNSCSWTRCTLQRETGSHCSLPYLPQLHY